MSFPNYGKHHHGWNARNDEYQVYNYNQDPTLEFEPRRYTDSPHRYTYSPHYPKAHVTFKSNDYKELIPESSSKPKRRMADYLYDQVPAPQSVKNGGRHQRVIEEDINEEADEFIKLEHQRIELSRFASMRAA
ncbi:hypothetical protein O6P43_023162 [Quillaja saponaria]|uniref:Uncharacterized protein n=1 Tax=Quillaja saponaria TaxID=32244 RepID=A0AAD7LG67_QUISA|nr:hypothetical protein O6P43_023162 [Quillaja saponaria]